MAQLMRGDGDPDLPTVGRQAVLDRLFVLSPTLQVVYTLREQLTQIFETATGKNSAKGS